MAQNAPSVSKMAICGPRLKSKNGISHRAKIKKLGWELKAQKCNKNPENECIKKFFSKFFFQAKNVRLDLPINSIPMKPYLRTL